MLVVFKLLSAIAFMSYFFESSRIIFLKNKKLNKELVILPLVFLSFYYYILFHVNEFLFCVALIFISIVFIKMFSEQDMISITILTLILNLIRMIFKACILFIYKKYTYNLFLFNNFSKETFYINFLSIIISFLFVFIFKNKIRKIIEKSFELNHCYIEILLLIIFNVIVVCLLSYPIINLQITIFLDIILILSLVISFLYLLDKDTKLNSISRYYAEVFEYSRLSDEINFDYRKKVHENKNQLIMIRSMLDGNNKKELIKYINDLLEIHNNDIRNYWLSDLSYIPFSGIKNFLNHKLIELQDLGASIEVYVSSEIDSVKEFKFPTNLYNDLNTILGVVLDNMIESLKEMDLKLASINIYIEDNTVYGEFANNFDGYIDIDKLFKLGYTTKGGGHGVGLTLVKDITRKSEKLGCEPSIIDNFFIQTVTVKLDDNLENTKNH